MEMLLILTYTALCVVIFKLFRIPLNKWSVPTAILGGVVMIGAILFGMNYNHPYSEFARQYFLSTPIVPQVRGPVIEIPDTVRRSQPVKKGDTLFKIDPTRYENEVKRLSAQLSAAREDHNDAVELRRRGIGRDREVEQTLSKLTQLQAQLDQARYELDETLVKAPSDGHVAQVIVREGMMATPLPMRPVMAFIPEQPPFVTAWFRQNSLLRLEPGNEAEVIFDALPGKVFKGEVVQAGSAMVEGQLQPSGDLVDPRRFSTPGRVPVAIRITDEQWQSYQLPAGSYAQVAVYSEHFHHAAMIRRILLRMQSWMHYIYPLH